jgi:GAF domain-containing protein
MTDASPSPERTIALLRRTLAALEAANRSLLPHSNIELLQSIVDAAARIFGAAAASISLVDEAQQMLEFRVAYGVGRDDVVGMRIRVDQGIAGYVAMTGQPIAVSSVQQDPRFQREFAQSTGYVPRSILAMPLLLGDRVIGVMEVLDKINAPSFGLQDMELLGVFAQQAAIAIHQSQHYEDIGAALRQGFQRALDGEADELFRGLAERSEEEAARDADLMELAQLFYDLGSAGPHERRVCQQVLAVFGEYVRSQPGLG